MGQQSSLDLSGVVETVVFEVPLAGVSSQTASLAEGVCDASHHIRLVLLLLLVAWRHTIKPKFGTSYQTISETVDRM